MYYRCQCGPKSIYSTSPNLNTKVLPNREGGQLPGHTQAGRPACWDHWSNGEFDKSAPLDSHNQSRQGAVLRPSSNLLPAKINILQVMFAQHIACYGLANLLRVMSAWPPCFIIVLRACQMWLYTSTLCSGLSCLAADGSAQPVRVS